jgi:hypothetical protein
MFQLTLRIPDRATGSVWLNTRFPTIPSAVINTMGLRIILFATAPATWSLPFFLDNSVPAVVP